jgi:hypothetical protein
LAAEGRLSRKGFELKIKPTDLPLVTEQTTGKIPQALLVGDIVSILRPTENNLFPVAKVFRTVESDSKPGTYQSINIGPLKHQDALTLVKSARLPKSAKYKPFVRLEHCLGRKFWTRTFDIGSRHVNNEN